MGADKGVIIKLDQARGINKGLARMCAIAVKAAGDTAEKTAVIAHCNNHARAEQVRDELLKLAPFKEIVITETAGVATVYAGDGGIVLAIQWWIKNEIKTIRKRNAWFAKVARWSFSVRIADLLNQLQGKNRQLWQFMMAA